MMGGYRTPLLDPTTDCTLVVVTRDRHHLLERCLLQGLREVATSGVPIVLVDQSSGPETARLVDDIVGLRYLRSGPGLSVGRNVGVEAVATPLVVFTDDDVTIGPGWIESIVAAFAQAPDVGVVCGRARTPRGDLIDGCRQGVYRWPTDPFVLGSGYNMAFRRQALADAGPFDPHLGAGGRYASSEDIDMFYRVLRAGWAVVCREDVVVVHHDWRSHLQDFVLQFRYGVGAGAQTAKHLRAGDRSAGRLGVARANRQARMVGAALAGAHVRVAAKGTSFIAGMVVGVVLRLAAPSRPTTPPGSDAAVMSPTIYRDGYRRHFRPDEKGPFRAIYQAKLESVLAPLLREDPLRILDVGGGYGRLSGPLASRHQVTLVDLSPEMLREARSGWGRSVALVEGDARRLPFPEDSFDVVIALDLLVHLPDVAEGLRELTRVVKVGGRLMADTTNCSPWWVPAYPAYVSWRPRRLVRTMRSGGVLPEWTAVVRHQRASEVNQLMGDVGLEVRGMATFGPPWCAKWHLWQAVRTNGGAPTHGG